MRNFAAQISKSEQILLQKTIRPGVPDYKNLMHNSGLITSVKQPGKK